MGITERRIREKAERKALIKRCAKELILEHGAEKVSMMDIAKKAELSKATLYLYFSSKDLLFKEICFQAAEQFLEYFYSRRQPGISAMDGLRLFWSCYLELFGESEDMVIFFSMRHYLAPDYPFIPIEEDSRSPIGSAYEFYTLLTSMITQGIGEGLFDPEINADMVSRTILLLFSFIVENAVKLPKSARKSQFIIEEMKNLFQIFFYGIARKGVERSSLALVNPGAEKEQNHG
jgi:AcrR family transcriptional regulator